MKLLIYKNSAESLYIQLKTALKCIGLSVYLCLILVL